MFNLLSKTFWDKRFFILGWALGLLILSYSITILFPSFSGDMMDELAKSMPAAMQGFIGDLANLKQFDSYVGTQVFEINLPIFLCVLAVLLAVGLSVTEEDKGQLRTLISLPLSRRTIIFAKWLAIVGVGFITALALTGGVYAGVWQINESIDGLAMVYLTLITWLLTVTIATIIFGVGLATGSRAVTVTVGVVVAAGSYLLTTFAQGVDWLKDYEWASIFYYFPAADIAKGIVEASNILVYVGLIVVALIVALLLFPRRDIKAN